MELQFVEGLFEEADTQVVCDTRPELLKTYENRGYKLIQEDGGILVKPAKISVKLKGEQLFTMNVNKQVCKHYNETKVSRELFERFMFDAEKRQIKFILSPEN